MIKLKSILEGAMHAVRHYAVLASVSAALITILSAVGFNYWLYHRVTDLGSEYSSLISKVDSQNAINHHSEIRILERFYAVQLQCQTLESSVKASNLKFRYLKESIDENHPR